MKVNIRMAKNMEKGHIIGQIKAIIQEVGTKIKYMDTDNIFGIMEENMWANGGLIKCMDLVFILGKMVGVMKVIIKMIKNMDLENIGGLTAEYLKENGFKVNEKVKEK